MDLLATALLAQCIAVATNSKRSAIQGEPLLTMRTSLGLWATSESPYDIATRRVSFTKGSCSLQAESHEANDSQSFQENPATSSWSPKLDRDK
eukprot:3767167-Amphidinium_carterae.1